MQQKNSKQSDFQSASIESTNNNKGLKMNVTSPTLSINKYGSRTFDTVSTKEQVDVEKIDADNSFTQELMEWEPIEEEKILSHIQEVRNQIQQDGGINPDEIMQKPDYETMSVFSESGKTEWFIVLDTNILLSSLTYVEELRDTNFKGLGFPILIIPWQVLQELDILKDQRGGVKNSSVTARARKAVSFLHSNFVTKHPRVRGQSALDAFPQDFKMEVPDDAILQCCLHIVHRTQQVILLSNDKNLCNKAIVNGIRAYQKSEIEQALQGFHPDSIGEVPNNSAGNAGLSDSRVDTSTLICDTQEEREASKADLIICKLKSVLKDLLSRVLENEMNKVYGQSWLKVIAIKPPWTLSEILVCMLKHWIAVLGFVLPSNIKPSLECLQTFFAKTTGYGHSVSDIKKILKTSAKLCESIHNNEYSNYVSSCISSIEKLQQYCEATENLRRSPVKTQTEDLNPVIETLEKCWNSVHSFCAITCDILNMKHNFTYVRPDPMPTVDFVRDNLPDVYPRVHALTKAILRIEQFPVSNLDVNNEAIRSLYTTLTNLLRSNEVDETFTPELVLKFCTVPNTRQMLIKAGTMFKEIQAILDTAINRLVQSGMA
ncbi:transcriptional protein SWT1 [Periplaneta americana]|uniref:transcriptional protein SWT1 n=1 Tax=Periplaneta americana TaxID=6978 RepID=UPI0037E93575